MKCNRCSQEAAPGKKSCDACLIRQRLTNERTIHRNRLWLAAYLRSNPCECGEERISALEFDHVTGKKEANVSTLVAAGYSLSHIKLEILQCEVVCGTCHNIRTQMRSKGWRSILEEEIVGSDDPNFQIWFDAKMDELEEGMM